MVSSKRILYWIRKDLRLENNAALAWAHSQGGVLPVFIWNPEEDGEWSPGSASKWYLHESLVKLSDSYEKLNGKLVFIHTQDSFTSLINLAKENQIDSICWNRSYLPHDWLRDKYIQKRLVEYGIEVRTFEGETLTEPGKILNANGQYYQVFTPFSKAVFNFDVVVEPTSFTGNYLKPISQGVDLDQLQLRPQKKWFHEFDSIWAPGEKGAQRLWGDFSENNLSQYELKRDVPHMEGGSLLGPALSWGEISVRKIWHMAGENVCPSSHAFRRQLIWRDFARLWLWSNPHCLSEPWKSSFASMKTSENELWQNAWRYGKTGFHLIDAGQKQLWKTGYMPNRIRMLSAAFYTKQMNQSWQSGCKWFWDTLVDADLANNHFGWQWSAGCGADAAPYFRIFNPDLQQKKFDPEMIYINKWISGERVTPILDLAQARQECLERYQEVKSHHKDVKG
jgi:deoxyribodipyrimidine photo-lyase